MGLIFSSCSGVRSSLFQPVFHEGANRFHESVAVFFVWRFPGDDCAGDSARRKNDGEVKAILLFVRGFMAATMI